MLTKTCCGCKKRRGVRFFKSHSKRLDGLQSQCIDCQKKYRRQHYLKNRQKYIDKAKKLKEESRSWYNEYKNTLKCSTCPENHPACLDFHHRDSKTKLGNVSSMVYNSKKMLLEEIKKCDVICANCHRKKHS
jgi:hypothetical protein